MSADVRALLDQLGADIRTVATSAPVRTDERPVRGEAHE